MENKKYYTARKLKPRGKADSFWVLEFRHPLSKDASGKSGKKIRKGLGTKDDNEADTWVQEMNELLKNESYWQPASRSIAQDKFNLDIVNAFYGEIDNYVFPDYDKIRETKIPMRTKDEGYSRVLLLGTTGAGKTTLVSQLMGLHPKKERFLATSTSKTTVYDTEIILSSSAFKCIVTFYSEGETRQFIKESIRNSMVEHFTINDDNQTLRVFLEDRNQRFRLSQLIGKISISKEDEDDERDEEEADEEELFPSEIEVLNEYQKFIDEKIKGYLAKIKAISSRIVENVEKEWGKLSEVPEDKKRTLEDIIIMALEENDDEDIDSLEEDIIIEIKERFNEIEESDLVTEKFGWPVYWFHEQEITCPNCKATINNYQPDGTIKCSCGYDSRKINHQETIDATKLKFLKSINVFTSNSIKQFGKLLTPLVSGMRIEGPFKPNYLNEIPKLVLIDGEGLGHNPKSSYSLPPKTIKNIGACDAIMLVDNSQSPMLPPPATVIKTTASTGYYKKIFLCFSHFDQVKGPNLPDFKTKKSHIFGSVDNLLESLKGEQENSDITKYLKKHLDKYSYYLGFLDVDINQGNKFGFKKSIEEIDRLIRDLQTIIIAPDINIVKPKYELSNLNFKIQEAAIEFHKNWDTRLFGSSVARKEHYTRIKALARRHGSYEGGLFPVSDFHSYFITKISAFVNSPTSWFPTNPLDDEKENALNRIKNELDSKLLEFAENNIVNNKINDWDIAYWYRGTGSAEDRARKIKSIFLDAVRIESVLMTRESQKFLDDMAKISIDAVLKNGGEIIKPYGV